LSYRGQKLRQVYQPDFIKAVSALVDEHRAQLLNYLSATRFQLGPSEFRRLANTKKPRGMENQDLTL
jgi:hypothetical protein